eukprot:NODE_25654_length_579_cov_3.758850.p1 GENE.NODE_25654_length_579_cov_3.758850~~NODE_25654_length_579_cov_3.758850.p1  ORF type:complete len:139 (+),score=45.48 NODE_25654_length_579_cov_3.758850:142-558(+)
MEADWRGIDCGDDVRQLFKGAREWNGAAGDQLSPCEAECGDGAEMRWSEIGNGGSCGGDVEKFYKSPPDGGDDICHEAAVVQQAHDNWAKFARGGGNELSDISSHWTRERTVRVEVREPYAQLGASWECCSSMTGGLL